MPLSQMAMTWFFAEWILVTSPYTAMRSAFRDYMGEMTDHPESVVEQALAHQVGDRPFELSARYAFLEAPACHARLGQLHRWSKNLTLNARRRTYAKNAPEQARE